ncbi:hypothetical protein EUBSIR_02100 [[Eubacterium] siraeum DSM 15702]|uniref:Uncharacterized protein n=1 Tax=[Eubacterium] siraeum DSM 15702 TaxID=428128 RepID=B0MQI4_9FIRM|nr:hypothetical protein EUBSIR_02100 [[Eubacterium] siraeum DSM 15702]
MITAQAVLLQERSYRRCDTAPAKYNESLYTSPRSISRNSPDEKSGEFLCA